MTQYILTLTCPNRPGIVAAVANAIFEHGGNIRESQQFDDRQSASFFARIVLDHPVDQLDVPALRHALDRIAGWFGMTLSLRDAAMRQRVMILASKSDHCLADILYRWRIGELPMDIVGIVSNHPQRDVSKRRFWTTSRSTIGHVTKDTKSEQEAQLWSLVQETHPDLVVLARYMQVLSDELAGKLAGRCINIHHSFLPGFKGAKPYHQAHERGVKIIGATAHFVTAELDEGPIIEQDVERIAMRTRRKILSVWAGISSVGYCPEPCDGCFRVAS